jgi:hypothetical protein
LPVNPKQAFVIDNGSAIPDSTEAFPKPFTWVFVCNLRQPLDNRHVIFYGTIVQVASAQL